MFKYKKALCIMLSLCMVWMAFACGKDKTDESQSKKTDDLIVIGFSQPGAESAWRVALTDSVKESFTEENGYKLIYKDGRSKQDNQIKDIRTFIQQGVDYIILSPIVETGWDTVLLEAKEAGIPVIICDRNVVVNNQSLYTAYVGSNFLSEGERAIEYIENLYQPGADGVEPEVNIVHIQGTIDSSAQIGRSKALERALLEHDNWHIIAEECGEFTKARSKEIMKQTLTEVDSSEINVLYCENDEEAMGAIAALNEAGIKCGVGTSIAVISFDATKSALELCMNGQINMVAECNPIQGPYLYDIIEALNKGENVSKITYIDETSFTRDSLTEDFIASRKY